MIFNHEFWNTLTLKTIHFFRIKMYFYLQIQPTVVSSVCDDVAYDISFLINADEKRQTFYENTILANLYNLWKHPIKSISKGKFCAK